MADGSTKVFSPYRPSESGDGPPNPPERETTRLGQTPDGPVTTSLEELFEDLYGNGGLP